MSVLTIAAGAAYVGWVVTNEQMFNTYRKLLAQLSLKGPGWSVLTYPFLCTFCLSSWLSVAFSIIAGQWNPIVWAATAGAANMMIGAYRFLLSPRSPTASNVTTGRLVPSVFQTAPKTTAVEAAKKEQAEAVPSVFQTAPKTTGCGCGGTENA